MNTLKLLGVISIILLLSLLAALLIRPLCPFPFFLIFVRCLEIFGVVGIYLFRTRFQKKSFASLGFKAEGNALGWLLNGIVFALLSLLILTFIAYLYQAVSFYYHPPKLKKLLYYTTSAVLIGFFEEFFFRGLFLKTLMEDFPTWFSIGISSLVYSLVHFLQPFILNRPEDLSLFYTESIGLFLFGVLMAYAFLRTRSLYLSMGLHGGFIFFMKMDGIFVDRLMVKGWLFGEERLVGGIATWCIFLVAFPWISWLSRNVEKKAVSLSDTKL